MQGNRPRQKKRTQQSFFRVSNEKVLGTETIVFTPTEHTHTHTHADTARASHAL